MGKGALELIFVAPAILFALVIHEFAHGLVADGLGDPTPRHAGRLTLNPLRHLDPVGTVMLLLVRVGWARPVPVNPAYFDNPRVGMILVSLAGPGANMVGALACGLLLRLVTPPLAGSASGATEAVVSLLFWGMGINLILAAFNLLPVPPLDGSNILMGLLPARAVPVYRRLRRLGPLLLVAFILAGRSLVWSFILPFLRFFSVIFAGQKAVHLLSTF